MIDAAGRIRRMKKGLPEEVDWRRTIEVDRRNFAIGREAVMGSVRFVASRINFSLSRNDR